MDEVEALQYRNSWLVFFFLSLCVSPAVGGVQVLAKQQPAGGGRPGSSGGVDRNCFKNINRKTTDYLGSHSGFFSFCFRDFSKPFWHHRSI